jgi:hypothetical protein
MERSESRPAPAGKYVVASRLGRWRVLRNDSDVGAFSGRDEAVRFACGLARDQAEAGTVAVVVVQADVHEMHCFSPPAGIPAAARPAKLRLIGRAQ